MPEHSLQSIETTARCGAACHPPWKAKKSDVVDAALVLLATDGDTIVTSDPKDLLPLARGAGHVVDLIEV
jgi:hypothetical protein